MGNARRAAEFAAWLIFSLVFVYCFCYMLVRLLEWAALLWWGHP